ncbi:hypothetical protein GF391_02860 [Candidatus Uhrbacteria bacterium]|nr:hypothetical protein [Candidatus Uhrbacteria bacterium]
MLNKPYPGGRMKQTDLLKGRIFRLKDRGQSEKYCASFDISDYTTVKPPLSVHLALAKTTDDDWSVSFYVLGKVPIIRHHTRLYSELINGLPANVFGKEVFPREFVRLLAKFGLDCYKYIDLVEEARFQLTTD